MRRRQKNPQSPPWYLLTGLLLGLILGLVYSLIISPAHFADIAPNALRQDYKDTYRGLIALAFQADKDVGRAAARLALLQDNNVTGLLTARAQQLLAAGGSPDEARALSNLADALKEMPSSPTPAPTSIFSPTPSLIFIVSPSATLDENQAIRSPTPEPLSSVTPVPSFTPRVTEIPASMLNAPFVLREQTQICDPDLVEPLFQVEVLDENNSPMPGVSIEITWENGQDYFLTGLYPQISPGYADYQLQSGIKYSLRAGSSGQTVSDLSSVLCTAESGSTYQGGWKLVFIQP
jgi:hypothetical protein